MNSIKKILLSIITATCFVTGCSDDFVNTKPLIEVPSDDVWKDAGLATAFVTELYGGLGQGGFEEEMRSESVV